MSFFPSLGGLCQGDLPLLFNLVMETLFRLMSKVVEVGLLEGFQIDSNLSVSHLLFVKAMDIDVRYLGFCYLKLGLGLD